MKQDKKHLRAWKIICQICAEPVMAIIKGILSEDHIHMFISVPPQYALSIVMCRIKGRSSRWVRQDFPRSASAIGTVISGRDAMSRPQAVS
ncbi:MAG: transposase [Pseudomonadota bacterium]